MRRRGGCVYIETWEVSSVTIEIVSVGMVCCCRRDNLSTLLGQSQLLTNIIYSLLNIAEPAFIARLPRSQTAADGTLAFFEAKNIVQLQPVTPRVRHPYNPAIGKPRRGERRERPTFSFFSKACLEANHATRSSHNRKPGNTKFACGRRDLCFFFPTENAFGGGGQPKSRRTRIGHP